MNYQAIIFDLDGTLLDTISLYERAVIESFGQWKVYISHERFARWYRNAVHLKEMLSKLGISDIHAPTVRLKRDNHYQHLLSTDVQWLPGGKELMDVLYGKVPLAIVTGSWMSYIDAIQKKIDIKHYTSIFVTADEIHKFMKPHPHGLLLAADRLGIAPSDCLYIGDQAFDMEAAQRAGMDGWLLRSAFTPDYAGEKAKKIFGSLGEVRKELLES